MSACLQNCTLFDGLHRSFARRPSIVIENGLIREVSKTAIALRRRCTESMRAGAS